MSIMSSIRNDIRAAYEHDPAAVNAWEVVFAYPGFHARQNHRLAHRLYSWRVPLLPRLISNLSRFFTGIEIHPGAQLAEGVFIDHGMGVVIGETAIVGENTLIYQGVTLGGASLLKKKRHPTLGRNVVVGVGAMVIGDITVGDGSKIGAGSVVINSVPSHATVIGVPGRVVAMRNPDADTVEHLPDPIGERLDQIEERLDRLDKQSKRTKDAHQ